MEFTAKQIAEFLNGTIEGDVTAKVNGFSKIEEGKPGTLTFLANIIYMARRQPSFWSTMTSIPRRP